MRRKAFTLVELLVVIGIIALLIAILLPVLNKAREQANQIKCLSNVRQIGMAFFMYADANYGRFPYSAPYAANEVDNEDWIWWQEVPVAPTGTNYGRPIVDFDSSAIAAYLSRPLNPNLFRCPSDDTSNRLSQGPGGYYRYSYSMNMHMSGANVNCPRLTSIRNSSEKVLLVEEDPLTINDGHWSPILVDDNLQQVSVNELTLAVTPVATVASNDLLSSVHDRYKIEPDAATAADQLPNADHRGNAAFIDGHAEFAPRSYVHNWRHVIPRADY
jgi:prepilin-type N-terminal cleavage/methylation domain-containing protein/prepilin-type processing-associated H-X9-DG protein